MKKILLVLVLIIASVNLNAQKSAFVDTEYILNKIPEYKTAQEQLDQLSKDYQKEVEAAYAEVDKMYKDFQAEKVLLSEDMKAKKEEAIITKEKDAKAKQKKYFGQEGELYKKRQELVKPIQDQVYTAIKEIAQSQSYGIIFDIAAGSTLLYTDPKFDKSDEVLKKLGYNK